MHFMARRRAGLTWPTEMVIHVEHQDRYLTRLLYARFAWDLEPDVDVPVPLSPEPLRGRSSRPATVSSTDWAHRWAAAWQERLDVLVAGTGVLPGGLGAHNLEGYWNWRRTQPQDWYEAYGGNGFDIDALNRWQSTFGVEEFRPKSRHPEREVLPALVPAWEGGLQQVIVLPLAGLYDRRVSADVLVVSNTTRNDIHLYSQALSR